MGHLLLGGINLSVTVCNIWEGGEARLMPDVATNGGSVLAVNNPSLAVLPLASDASADARYFSDGVTEDIVTELSRFRELAVVCVGELSSNDPAQVAVTTLAPAFMLSELKTSFLIGFQIYLPFLILDMVISSVMISMGMLMLPPVLISLPFKLLLFVLADGWRLVVGMLLDSFQPFS